MKYEVITTTPPKSSELQLLFKQTTWAKERTNKDIEVMLENTIYFVQVRHKSTLIGYGRALSDGVYRAIVDDIVVDMNYRNQGIGHQIMKELLHQLEDVEQIFLNTKPELEGFYSSLGFAKSKSFGMSLG